MIISPLLHFQHKCMRILCDLPMVRCWGAGERSSRCLLKLNAGALSARVLPHSLHTLNFGPQLLQS